MLKILRNYYKRFRARKMPNKKYKAIFKKLKIILMLKSSSYLLNTTLKGKMMVRHRNYRKVCKNPRKEER